MHGIAAHNVEDLGIFFTVRTKGFPALGDIPEKIFDLGQVSNLSSLSTQVYLPLFAYHHDQQWLSDRRSVPA